MAHNFQTHVPVSPECRCCRLQYKTEFASKSEHVMCNICKGHFGTTQEKSAKRNADHLNQWESYTRQLRDHLAEQEQTLRTEIGQLQDDLETARGESNTARSELEHMLREAAEGQKLTPTDGTLDWLEGVAIKEAQDLRDAAYRSRDKAFNALLLIGDVHHEDEQNEMRCSCGQKLTDCEVVTALSPLSMALNRWEAHQVERAKRGKRYSLPDDHPKIKVLIKNGVVSTR